MTAIRPNNLNKAKNDVIYSNFVKQFCTVIWSFEYMEEFVFSDVRIDFLIQQTGTCFVK